MQGLDIYDQDGNPIKDYDPAKGWITEQTRTHHHEAVEAVEEQGHWETVAEYPETGGKDVQWVADVPGVEAREAWDEEEVYLLYTPYTEEELAEMEKAAQQPTPEERIKELEEALELLLSGATEVEEAKVDEARIAGEDTGL